MEVYAPEFLKYFYITNLYYITLASDRNGNGNGHKGAGVVFGVSNDVVAIIGGVAIIGIGAHLLGEILKPRPQFSHTSNLGSGGGETPTLIESMYAECADSATHPEQVHRNKDRVLAAIKQRIPRLQTLTERYAKGKIGRDKIGQGIQRNARDVLDQLEIPSEPHPSAAPPALVRLFEEQRQHHMSRQYHHPGQLILNGAERKYYENEAMSYAVTTDPVERQRKKDNIKAQAEMQRLAALRAAHAARQAAIQSLDANKHVLQRAWQTPVGTGMQGSMYPIG